MTSSFSKSNRAPKAFTLVEILVVVVILSVLATILFPAFSRVRERGRASACASNLRQLGLSIAQYAADHDDKLPYAPSPESKEIASRPQFVFGEPLDTLILGMPDVRMVLKPYGATNELFRCPSDRFDRIFLAEFPNHTSHFGKWGSSYSYDDRNGLSGKTLGSYAHPDSASIMADVDTFHGGDLNDFRNGSSLSNVLYADGHVKLVSSYAAVAAMEEADR